MARAGPINEEDEEADGYPDVPKEVKDAARVLCMMKHAEVDEETLAKLWRTVKRTRTSVGKMVADHEEERDDIVIPANGDQDPRRERLEAMMGQRSKPFKKKLKCSDLDECQLRLHLMESSVSNHIIPLLREAEDVHEGISVTVFNSEGVGFPMMFKARGNKKYALMRGWLGFLHENDLKGRIDQWITVETFRHTDTDQLSFLISMAENTPVGADDRRLVPIEMPNNTD